MTDNWTRREALAACGAVVSATAAGCSTISDSTVDLDVMPLQYPATTWPLAGFDSRNRSYNPDAAVPRLGVSVDGSFESTVGPIADLLVAEDALVVSGNDGAEVRGRATGDRHWQTSAPVQSAALGRSGEAGRRAHLVLGGPTRETAAVVTLRIDGTAVERVRETAIDGHSNFRQDIVPTESLLFVGGDAGRVAVLDAASGDRLVDLPGEQVALGDGRVVTATGGQLRAFDADSVSAGSSDEPSPDWTHTVTQGRFLRPAVSGEGVLCGARPFGADDGRLSCLRLADGSTRWGPRSYGEWTPTPATADGVCFAAGTAGTLAAVDLATGAERWTTTLGGRPADVLVGGDGTVVVGQNGPRRADGGATESGAVVEAYESTTGRSVWRFEPETNGELRAVRAVGDRLFVAIDATVFTLRGSG